MTAQTLLRFSAPLLALALAAPALAQATPATAAPVAAADQPYVDVFNVLVGGLDIDQMATLGADEIFDGMVRNDVSFSSMARRQPDLKGQFRVIARPYLAVWLKRSNEIRRPQVVAVLKKQMSPAEAREVAAFYGSPLGQKFMKAYSGNVTADKTVDAAIQNRSAAVDKAAQKADEKASVDGAVASLLPTLSPAEQRQLLAFSRTQGFKKMLGLSAILNSIPEPSFEAITTPAEREAFGMAVRKLFADARAKEE